MSAPRTVARVPQPDTPAATDGLGPASTQARLRLGMLVLVAALLAVALVAGSAPVAIRAPVVLLAALLLPGYPLVVGLEVHLVALLALNVCTSLAVVSGIAYLSVVGRFWHPQSLSLVLAVVAASAALAAVQRLRGALADTPPARASPVLQPTDRTGGWAWAVPVAGVVLWSVTLIRTDANGLGPWGLLPALSFAYWVALVVVLVGLVALIQSTRLRHGPILAHLGSLLLLLYASAPALEDVPRYAFTYKHLAVTQYIERYGSVDKTIDIYHRWPGFFSLTAVFSQLSGAYDPASYAAWAEVFFASADALLAWAIAHAMTRSARLAWSTAVIMTLTNWVGQNYYSPQAFGFVLMLGILLACLLFLRGDPNGFGRWIERVVVLVFRIRAPLIDPPLSPRPKNLTRVVALILLMDAMLVASHQLTPYVLLMQLGALMLVGYVRPWWVPVAAGVVTISYLVPNYDFIVNKFGILSSSDPLANATQKTFDGTPDVAERTISNIALAFLLVVFLVAFLGMVRRARAGHLRDAIVVALLVFVPPFILLVQSYGGEARLRVFLYALPWCCTAMGWIWAPTGRRTRGLATLAPLALSLALAAGFVFLFFGREDLNQLTTDEVGAAATLFDADHTAAGAVVMLTSPNFPSRFGPLYFRLATSDLPSLTSSGFADRPSLAHAGPADVAEAVRLIKAEGGSEGYLVFSQGQAAYAKDYQFYRNGGLRSFEAAVARSAQFRLVYDRPTAKIFKLVG